MPVDNLDSFPAPRTLKLASDRCIILKRRPRRGEGLARQQPSACQGPAGYSQGQQKAHWACFKACSRLDIPTLMCKWCVDYTCYMLLTWCAQVLRAAAAHTNIAGTQPEPSMSCLQMTYRSACCVKAFFCTAGSCHAVGGP